MEKTSFESARGLLEQPSYLPSHTSKPRKRWSGLCQTATSTLVLIFLVINAVLLYLDVRARSKSSSEAWVYTPPNEAVRYEVTDAWDDGASSKFLHGTLNETTDEWEKLLRGINIRVSEEDMYRTQADFSSVEDAVRLVDGDYVGVLWVYHSLHCLHTMRVALNPDAFDVTEKQKAERMNVGHYYHCIDSIRDSLMCQPDLSVYRATWAGKANELNPKETRSSAQRQCVNWNAIEQWVDQRRLDGWSFYVRPGPFEDNYSRPPRDD